MSVRCSWSLSNGSTQVQTSQRIDEHKECLEQQPSKDTPMIRQDQEHLQNQDHSHILQTEEAAGSASAREGWER